jgi:hypothetical protein
MLTVNDTDHVLGTLDWTFDRDGNGAPSPGVVTGASIAAVTVITTAAITDVDFGYTADDQKPNRA